MNDTEIDIQSVMSAIDYTYDGPLTEYVAIARAMRIMATKRYSTEVVTEALYNVLGRSNKVLAQSTEY